MSQPQPQVNLKQQLHAIEELSTEMVGDKIAKQELKKKFAANEMSQSMQVLLHKVFKVFVIVVSFVAISVVTVRLIHLVLPGREEAYYLRQWLTNEQIQGIDKLFFSGAIGGFIANYFKKTNE